MKILFLTLVLVSGHALAWGPTGHRVVGEVAEKFLRSDVHLKALQILKGNSLSRVSNWPDEIKSEPATYSYTYNWHYTDWPDDMHEHDEEVSSGTLVKSINDQMKILASQDATPAQKEFALKFLVHLVGDLHMPLHVGNGMDRGGNDCKVLFHNERTNLHALWDEGMINFTRLSYTELADYVSQGRTLTEISSWKNGDVTDWARESKILRSKIYPAPVISSDETMSSYNYCRNDLDLDTAALPKLSYEYSYQFVPVMEQRLFQAGLRLAQILNKVL